MSKIEEILKKTHALVTDTHVVLTSGRHSDSYFNKNDVYTNPIMASELGLEIAKHFQDKEIDTVLGPAMGAIILSQWTAYHLSQLKKDVTVLSVYADKNDSDGFVIKRGYDKRVTGKKVLLVEDILTTGNSIKKVIELVKSINGNIIGLATVCNRGNLKREDFNVPELYSLFDINLPSWEENECPLCQKNIPINTTLGWGKEFLARKNS